MQQWCTPDDVRPRLVALNVPLPLLQEYCEQATSYMISMSGGTYTGRIETTIVAPTDSRGRVFLRDYLPVHSVSAASVGPTAVSWKLSRAGSFVTIQREYRMNTVTLTIVHGQDPPASGKRAAAALAAAMIREDPRYAALGQPDGSPPRDVRSDSRVSSIARQGKTISFTSVTDLAKAKMTGVSEVDMFLRAENPYDAKYQPRVVTHHE